MSTACAHWLGTYTARDSTVRCRSCYRLCTPEEAAAVQTAAVRRKGDAEDALKLLREHDPDAPARVHPDAVDKILAALAVALGATVPEAAATILREHSDLPTLTVSHAVQLLTQRGLI